MKDLIGKERNIDITVINAVTVNAYEQIAQRHGISIEEVVQNGNCGNICDIVIQQLRVRGIWSEILITDVEDRGIKVGENELNYHTHMDLGNGWRFDPAWQIFLERFESTLPIVLFLPKIHLTKVLTKYGVDSRFHFLWTEAIPESDLYFPEKLLVA